MNETEIYINIYAVFITCPACTHNILRATHRNKQEY